jgi:hypothetical protein
VTELLATTRLDDEQRECLNTIQASARSLLALVEEVLDISAIEAGKLRVVAATSRWPSWCRRSAADPGAQARAKSAWTTACSSPGCPTGCMATSATCARSC